MKILLVNKFWYPKGGSERVVLATKQLLESAGHTVEIFGMHHPENLFSNQYFIPEIDYSRARGWTAVSLALKSIYNKEAKQKFAKLVEDFRPDVVHFHNIYHQLSFSLLDVVREKNIPSVMTLHDYKLLNPNYNLFHHGAVHEEGSGGGYYHTLLQNAEEHLGQSAIAMIEAYVRRFRKYHDVITTYVSPSEFLKNKFVSYGWEPERFDVVPNPIDAAAYPFTMTDNGSVAFIGRLSEEKGLGLFLDVAQSLPDIPFAVVGTGPLASYLTDRVKTEYIKNVTWYGFQTGQALREYIAAARIIVVPSLWYENYPQSVLEAKAMGKIVVASDRGGLKELLPPNCLATPGDKHAFTAKVKEWYTTPPSERLRVGQEFRQEVMEKNSPSAYVKSILNAYQGAIEKK